MKEEELYTILIASGFAVIYIIPAIVLAILHLGAAEYVVALTVFLLVGSMLWPHDMVLRG